MSDKNKQSGWIFIPQLIGYILCFAVPATILSLLFPAYIPWFALTAGVLMFSIAGFIVSRWWDHPDMTDEIRKSIRYYVIAFFIWMPLIKGIWDSIKNKNWMDLQFSIEFSAAIAATIYIPFFIGRAISRRRTGP